jgi:hypothetical protein
MKHNRFILTLLLVALALAACGGSDEDVEATATQDTASTGDTTTTTVQRQPLGASSFFAINEIGLGPNGYVALTNFTDVPVTTDGLYLCQGADCFALPDAVVAPGEAARVVVGDGTGLEGVVVTEADIGELRSPDGEIALYASPDFDEPGAMLVYLEWGSTPHKLTDVALAAGLWVEGSFAPTSEDATRLFRVEESGLWLFEEP